MHRQEAGFSLVELLIALMVGTAIMVAFFSLYQISTSMSTATIRQETARSIAYEGMRRYSQAQPVGWPTQFVCDSSTDKVASGGQTIETTDVTAQGLPSPSTLVIKATAPYGCSGGAVNAPVLVEATVQYGTPSKKVVYASYAKK
jgi:prepilin-type N-terminal cleavage/methylation domain-containing protein